MVTFSNNDLWLWTALPPTDKVDALSFHATPVLQVHRDNSLVDRAAAAESRPLRFLVAAAHAMLSG